MLAAGHAVAPARHLRPHLARRAVAAARGEARADGDDEVGGARRRSAPRAVVQRVAPSASIFSPCSRVAWKPTFGQRSIVTCRLYLLVARNTGLPSTSVASDGRLLALEVAPCRLVGKREPARGRDVGVVVDRVDLVLGREAVRDDLELQRADGAQQQRVARRRLEHLDRAFLAQLLQALGELLRLERIARARDAEELGREVRDALEGERLAFGQRVADLQLAVVVDADDVAGDRVLASARARWP